MFDWFDEPYVYYRRFVPMRSGVFDYMSRWMDSVDKAMEREFGDFYDSFITPPTNKSIKQNDDQDKDKNQSEQTENKEKKNSKSEDKKEEPKLQFYSCVSRMYSGSDGIQHIYREETDSKTGKKKYVETRRIGDKSMTLHRVTDSEGNVEEHETRNNIKDNEIESFQQEWLKHNSPSKAQLPEPNKEEEKEQKQ